MFYRSHISINELKSLIKGNPSSLLLKILFVNGFCGKVVKQSIDRPQTEQQNLQT